MVSDPTIFVVYKMLVICSFRSLGRQIKCGAAKTNVLSNSFFMGKKPKQQQGSAAHTANKNKVKYYPIVKALRILKS